MAEVERAVTVIQRNDGSYLLAVSGLDTRDTEDIVNLLHEGLSMVVSVGRR